MSGHTPGTWLSGNNFVYAVNDEGVNRFFAPIQPGWVVQGAQNRTTDDELQANARLIAAAPELLHACELMVKNGPLIAEWLKANDSAALAQVRAAIAKATGEAP